MLIPVLIFLVGYLIIALEHVVKIDKAATALFIGVILWVVIAATGTDLSDTILGLKEHFEEVSEILFFLLGAMTIVELIDAHNGFQIIQRLIRTKSMLALLWILSLVTFFLSAVLDNLTTTIVMVAILRKFLDQKIDLWFFASFIIIAANAGGAWSPIGDVTTIMLWNGGQVTTNTIISEVFLPSLACLMVPLILVSYKYRGKTVSMPDSTTGQAHKISSKESTSVLVLGVTLLLMVPVFKTITHLPPFMGMLFSLCILWLITEIIHKRKPLELKRQLSVAHTVQKIDTPSILFFLGILLAVAALETNGTLAFMGKVLERSFNDFHITNTLLGLMSALIDNVPLVAGAMGMYPLDIFPQDHRFWTFLAYCAGTGGSILIIGSAAGVAAMGILKIDFIWFLKRISLLALIGYFAGILVYMLLN